MIRRKTTKKIKLRFYTFSVFLCFGLTTLIFSDFGLKDLLKLKEQKNQLNLKINNLYEQQAALQQEINYLSSDMEYIEKIAREKFLMVKPGEKVFRVIENKTHQ
mgnify:CR=1 FL=1|tara:strand:+ start:1281 stop:1592 length:312 start_codon:yes stop_codon:yes gene_type:complete